MSRDFTGGDEVVSTPRIELDPFLADLRRMEREAEASARRSQQASRQLRDERGRFRTPYTPGGVSREEIRAHQQFREELRRGAEALDKQAASARNFGSVLKSVFAAAIVVEFFRRALRAATEFFSESIKAARELEGATGFLRTSSRQAFVGFDEAARGAERLRDAFGVTRESARTLYATALNLTRQLGRVGETDKFIRSVADALAAAGRPASELQETLKQIAANPEAAFDKILGGKNPSEIHREYARSLGTTADKLTSAQQKQAEFNAVIARGAEVAGAATARLQTTAGQLDVFEALVVDLKASVGEAVLQYGPFQEVLQRVNAALKDQTEVGKDVKAALDSLLPVIKLVAAASIIWATGWLQILNVVSGTIRGVADSVRYLDIRLREGSEAAERFADEADRRAAERIDSLRRVTDLGKRLLTEMFDLGDAPAAAGRRAGEGFRGAFELALRGFSIVPGLGGVGALPGQIKSFVDKSIADKAAADEAARIAAEKEAKRLRQVRDYLQEIVRGYEDARRARGDLGKLAEEELKLDRERTDALTRANDMLRDGNLNALEHADAVRLISLRYGELNETLKETARREAARLRFSQGTEALRLGGTVDFGGIPTETEIAAALRAHSAVAAREFVAEADKIRDEMTRTFGGFAEQAGIDLEVAINRAIRIKGFAALKELREKFREEISGVAEFAGHFVEGFFEKLGEGWEREADEAKRRAEEIKAAQDAVFADIVGRFQFTPGFSFDEARAMADTLGAIGESVDILTAKFGFQAHTVAALRAQYEAFLTGDVLSWTVEFADTISAMADQVEADLKRALIEAVPNIFSSLGEALGRAAAGVESFGDAMRRAMAALVADLAAMFGRLLILKGIGWLLLGNPVGAALIAAGIALQAFGAFIGAKYGGASQAAPGGAPAASAPPAQEERERRIPRRAFNTSGESTERGPGFFVGGLGRGLNVEIDVTFASTGNAFMDKFIEENALLSERNTSRGSVRRRLKRRMR